MLQRCGGRLLKASQLHGLSLLHGKPASEAGRTSVAAFFALAKDSIYLRASCLVVDPEKVVTWENIKARILSTRK
jgi:hypothetical protein